jgi:hypothetical protein
MAASLGALVDGQHLTLDIDALLAAWQPDGAIWYAHACCSAGCDNVNSYKELVPAGSTLASVLDGVAALGAQVAPLPQRLLGAAKPLRAFIGHVEPTFDWTLRQPETGQVLTARRLRRSTTTCTAPSPNRWAWPSTPATRSWASFFSSGNN